MNVTGRVKPEGEKVVNNTAPLMMTSDMSVKTAPSGLQDVLVGERLRIILWPGY